ncbi:hypothetical protein Vadar_034798 [Vaccinium darrowii]|uniref:Uncharacterized protein n=1 Tax=Vaccinium darrowii TaxID=229202 RepID=A0ACB7Y5G3_9ERIC|nr:hypothetical protein Vadar_034798 [Vaccinium darrowii]
MRNSLLSGKDSAGLLFTVEGRPIFIRTFGLVVSIIDSTLSRINTGDDILFLDLSLDPELFEGLKGDKQIRESSCSYQLWRFVPDHLKILSLCYSLQSDTYWEMREVTEDCWEGRIKLQKTKEICVH